MDGLRARRRVAVAATAAAAARQGQARASTSTRCCTCRCSPCSKPARSLIVITAVTVGGAIAGRRNWVKTVFNVGQMIVSCSASILVVYALGVTCSTPSVRDTAAAMLEALVVTLSAVSVAGIMSLAIGAPLRTLLSDIVRQFVPGSARSPWAGSAPSRREQINGRGPDGSRGHVRSPHERRDVPRADGPAALRARSAGGRRAAQPHRSRACP